MAAFESGQAGGKDGGKGARKGSISEEGCCEGAREKGLEEKALARLSRFRQGDKKVFHFGGIFDTKLRCRRFTVVGIADADRHRAGESDSQLMERVFVGAVVTDIEHGACGHGIRRDFRHPFTPDQALLDRQILGRDRFTGFETDRRVIQINPLYRQLER